MYIKIETLDVSRGGRPLSGELCGTISPDRNTVTHLGAEDAGRPLTLTVRTEQRGLLIIKLAGKLDITSAPALREQLLGLLRPAASQLVIDLSAVRYADASGLAVLVGTQRRAVLLGGALRLAAPPPEVASVLAVSGLGRHLDIYPTVRAAIAGWHLGERAPAAAAVA